MVVEITVDYVHVVCNPSTIQTITNNNTKEEKKYLHTATIEYTIDSICTIKIQARKQPDNAISSKHTNRIYNNNRAKKMSKIF